MRVYCCVKTVWILAALTAATLEPLVATAESDDGPIAVANSRFVVLGIDGKVVPDADPVLYFPKKLSRVYVDRSVERHALPSYSELDPVALGEWQGPDVTQQQRLQHVNKLQDQFVAQVMAPTVQVRLVITPALVTMRLAVLMVLNPSSGGGRGRIFGFNRVPRER
jgi:hypothetical protein